MTVRILLGDVRARLAELPADSVHCVVTSPPYWGLRDYGTATWEGGDPACDHRSPTMREGRDEQRTMLAGSATTNSAQLLLAARSVCGKCGARRVDAQLGLEPTPQEHVAAMVGVFRQVRRVLRPDGVCWVNYGDSYATSVNGRSAADTKAAGQDDRTFRDKPFGTATGGLKPKDLCMVPARFALAMQDDGWWLRSMMPWVKRNGMPESIKDRPATAVEYVFLFSRSERYWYDAEAVRREASTNTHSRISQNVAAQIGSKRANGSRKTNGSMKAVVRRPKLAEPRSGTRANSDFENATAGPVLLDRNFRNSDLFFESLEAPHGLLMDGEDLPLAMDVPPQPFKEAHFATFPPKLIEPLIKAGCPEGGTVLDPFGGAGTTGLVADRLRRNAILVELNPSYAGIARARIEGDSALFSSVAVEDGLSPGRRSIERAPASDRAGSPASENRVEREEAPSC